MAVLQETTTGRRALLLGVAGAIGGPGLGGRAATLAGTGLRIGMAAPNTTMDTHLRSNAPNNAVASRMFLGEACAVVFHDLAILPLYNEVTVGGAKHGITYATRADQYTLATGIGTLA